MLSSAALLMLAAPAFGAVIESLESLPHGWSQFHQQVSDDAPMKLQVALPYQNLHLLEATLAAVSTPGSPLYGHYLDVERQNEMFSPNSEAGDKVMSWLHQSGAQDIVSDGSIVSFTTTVGKANAMLDTKFHVYTDGKMTKLRTLGYSVPNDVAEHVDFVTPTTFFGSPKAQFSAEDRVEWRRSAAPTDVEKRQLQPSCERLITNYGSKHRKYTVLGPECLKQLYNTVGYKANPKSGSSVAFTNFLNESASHSDLALYEKEFGIPSQDFKVLALINGGVDDQNPQTESDGEANLDVQNLIGLVDGLPVSTYITGGVAPFIPDLLSPNQASDQNEPYLEFYQYVLSQPNHKLPYVMSNSYADHENTVPKKYAQRVCNMIGMMGIRGRSILFGSGDEGVGAVCRDNSGSNAPQFTPFFPATCPYVISVGGTQFYGPEAAWNGSSGGFSFYFDQPWYQKKAVSNYLTNHISKETKNYYSSNKYVDFAGRGFPDVAAHSLYPDYDIYVNGSASPSGGTSAATPVVAAIIALLNDARFRAGKPAMGFINPWLYGAAADTLNDINTGGSLGCNGVDLQNGLVIAGAGIIPYASFNATDGWDPVTGLGTPDFQKMKKSALDVCGWHKIPGGIFSFPPVGGWFSKLW